MSLIHVERLAGRKVRDSEGKVVGRLEEIHADWRGDECIVTHYTMAAKERHRPLSLSRILSVILRELGAHTYHGDVNIPWDKLDLSDPERPRLKDGYQVSGIVGIDA